MVEDIARNPNISPALMTWLAVAFPTPLLTNPVVPVWFSEQPTWLAKKDAEKIVAALRQHAEAISICSSDVLALLEQRAQ